MLLANLFEKPGKISPDSFKNIEFVVNLSLLDYKQKLLKNLDDLDEVVMHKLLKLIPYVDAHLIVDIAVLYGKKCSICVLSPFLSIVFDENESLFLEVLYQMFMSYDKKEKVLDLLHQNKENVTQISENLNNQLNSLNDFDQIKTYYGGIKRYVVLFRIFQKYTKSWNALKKFKAKKKSSIQEKHLKCESENLTMEDSAQITQKVGFGVSIPFEYTIVKLKKSLKLIKFKVFLNTLYHFRSITCEYKNLKWICDIFYIVFNELVQAEEDVIINYLIQQYFFDCLFDIIKSSSLFKLIKKNNSMKYDFHYLITSHIFEFITQKLQFKKNFVYGRTRIAQSQFDDNS